MAKKQFATRLIERVLLLRWWVILVTLLLVAVAAGGITQLEFVANYRIFFDGDNPQLQALEQLEDTYGKNENIVFLIVPDDGDATSKQALSAALWLTEQAWSTPYSRRVDSLVNFQFTTSDGDDLYVRDLVDPEQLDQAEVRAFIRQIGLTDPRITNSILARDADVSVVSVTVELPQGNLVGAVSEIAQFARTLETEAQARFTGIDLRIVGTVMINQSFLEASINSQKIFLPASLALMALVLGLLLRSWVGVVLTGLVIVLSIVVSIGVGAWVGMPFSPPVAPAPTIVLMIVVANCVHLLVGLRQRLLMGDANRDAIVKTVTINLKPIFIASLTTALGLLSMNFSEVPPQRHLGNFVAIGIIASFFLTATFLPALLSIFPIRATRSTHLHGALMDRLAHFSIRRRKVLIWGWLVIVVVMVFATARNELNDVLAHFFDESVEFRQDMDFMDERLSGNTLLEYSLGAADIGGVTDPLFLAEVDQFAQWYRDQPSVRHVSVITDTFRQLNKNMHGDNPEFYRIPQTRELAAQYLLLYEFSLPQGLDLNNQIDTSKSATRVSVSAVTLDSKALLELNARAEAWLQNNAPHVSSINSSGPASLFAYIGLRNMQAMLIGTVVVLVAISAILLFALRSIRLGLLSLVPNLIPALLGLGIWGLTVGQMNSSLSVVVAMTIGIVVDDTVHFLSKYLLARRDYNYDAEKAVQYAFNTAGTALFTTTVILVAGFLIFAFSPFVPTAQVGVLTALIIGSALIADLTLLPALVLALDKNSNAQKSKI